MATKKAPAPRFIAIDNSEGSVIEIGHHTEVREAIEEYVNDRCLNADEVNSYIEVFQIAEKRMIDVVAKGVEILF